MTIDPYILYGLALEPGQNINVGPYAWKTEVDLTTLGVPYRLEGRLYSEIRGSFEKETGNSKVTVPTLKSGNDYLEAKYGTPERSLFGGSEVGKAFARFINLWADNELGDEVKLLFAPWLYQAQEAAGDPDSARWFLQTKLGGSEVALKELLAASRDTAWFDNQTAVVRTRLGALERQLAANAAAGAGRFLAGTDYPTHADATVFGWYAASVAVRLYDVVGQTWKHESLPLVAKWVADVEEATGLKPKYPF